MVRALVRDAAGDRMGGWPVHDTWAEAAELRLSARWYRGLAHYASRRDKEWQLMWADHLEKLAEREERLLHARQRACSA